MEAFSSMELRLLERFRAIFTGLTRLNFRQKDDGAIKRYISARIKSKGLSTEEDYLGILSDKGSNAVAQERQELIKSFTTGEIYIFRDKGLSELLGSVIIPDLAKKASDRRDLQIWSAGCAAGEEPYSIAVMFKEMFPYLISGCLLLCIAPRSQHSLNISHSASQSKFRASNRSVYD